MALALPSGRDRVNNPVTAKGALGIERWEGGMSSQASRVAPIAQILCVARMECGLGGGVGWPAQSARARSVDLGGTWV
jgi:hypothetical protein